jgi:hypothetical protein
MRDENINPEDYPPGRRVRVLPSDYLEPGGDGIIAEWYDRDYVAVQFDFEFRCRAKFDTGETGPWIAGHPGGRVWVSVHDIQPRIFP